MLLGGEVADSGTCPAPKPRQLMPWVIWEQGKAVSSTVAGWSGASSSLPEHSARAQTISQPASCDLGRKSIMPAPGGQARGAQAVGSPGQAPWAGRQDHGEHLPPPEAPGTRCRKAPPSRAPRMGPVTWLCKRTEAPGGSGLQLSLTCSSSNFVFFFFSLFPVIIPSVGENKPL